MVLESGVNPFKQYVPGFTELSMHYRNWQENPKGDDFLALWQATRSELSKAYSVIEPYNMNKGMVRFFFQVTMDFTVTNDVRNLNEDELYRLLKSNADWMFTVLDSYRIPPSVQERALKGVITAVKNEKRQELAFMDWQSFGGRLTSGPAAAKSEEGNVQIFVRGADRKLLKTSFNGEVFDKWTEIPTKLSSSPAILLDGKRTVLVIRGEDHHLFLSESDVDSNVFSDWEDLGGTFTSTPTITSSQPGRIDVFVRGGNKRLYYKSKVKEKWSGWEEIGGPLTSAPTAISLAVGKLAVFARGSNRNLYLKEMEDQQWKDWVNLGGNLTSSPAVVVKDNRIEVFAKGDQEQLIYKSFAGDQWSNWKSIGGKITSEPTACLLEDNRVMVLARGQNGELVYTISN